MRESGGVVRQSTRRHENGDVTIVLEEGIMSFEVKVRALNNETRAAFSVRLRREKNALRLFAMRQIRAMRRVAS